jgi:GT2 family glycosyltransferase
MQRLRLRRSRLANGGESHDHASGLAVITYERLDYLKRCVESLNQHDWGHACARLIVDDGSTQAGYADFLEECRARGILVMRNERNSGVAVTKNKALRGLMECGCEHLFLMEDDILMKSDQTLRHYITFAREIKLQHLNFALHGELNLGQEMFYRKDGRWILCYPDLTGAFSYYTREVVGKIGYMDEEFHNALEHVEHTYRIALGGYTLPFWYFADHPLNREFFEEQPEALATSVIRQGDWQDKVAKAKEHWISKHGTWLPPRPY